ncbi:hypothetical protein [Larkinella rosea]|uniref:Uncharacterized protein n=1 Tax=Larkinella rosea TaxID=2025312 RepID=A0A3P1BD25_9BACT|nr:hypothetical protein [Larkinella rosea]RRA98969.1 hypothetical protein EHT25_28720 [Larkinella rosea]
MKFTNPIIRDFPPFIPTKLLSVGNRFPSATGANSFESEFEAIRHETTATFLLRPVFACAGRGANDHNR